MLNIIAYNEAITIAKAINIKWSINSTSSTQKQYSLRVIPESEIHFFT